MFGIGTTEILVILVVALIVLGPKSLPKIARTLGKGMAEFRRVSTDFQRTINTEIAMDDHEKRKKEASKRLFDEEEPPAPPKKKSTAAKSTKSGKAAKAKTAGTAKASGDLAVAPDPVAEGTDSVTKSPSPTGEQA